MLDWHGISPSSMWSACLLNSPTHAMQQNTGVFLKSGWKRKAVNCLQIVVSWIESQPDGFDANKRVAQAGGSVAGNARKDLEQRLGRPVITSQNAAQLNHVVTQMIEASVTAADDEEKAEEWFLRLRKTSGGFLYPPTAGCGFLSATHSWWNRKQRVQRRQTQYGKEMATAVTCKAAVSSRCFMPPWSCWYIFGGMGGVFRGWDGYFTQPYSNTALDRP